MLVEAEARARQLDAQASLGAVNTGALDEMFSQGEPVLAGVDLDSGYLFGLSWSPTRDGTSWAEVLREGPGQGLALSVVVKDAAKRIVAGVSEVFPLVLAQKSVLPRLDALGERWSMQAVTLACICWYLLSKFIVGVDLPQPRHSCR